MKPARSRILTFYSYKGGTGRTMALANVAWVLASNGCRVLAIDWDLEAPGLHRYFHPFLIDPELTASPGVIDLLSAFVEAATAPAEGDDERWHEALADIREYAVAVAWKFPSPGRLDLVPAGRQGPGYAARVNAFDWQHFYDELGGGAFLEEVKARMAEHYDCVLIDSRTGVSDTAGICTVQMPDTLVVCFTANRQSVEGAAAVARSVRQAWADLPETSRPRRIFPVLTRVELGEKERLGRAQEHARAVFAPFLDHLAPDSRPAYWDRVETLYYPFYAYEEVLAVFGDRPGQSRSVLASAEQLTGYLTEGAVTGLIAPTEEERASVLSRLLRAHLGRSDRAKPGAGPAVRPVRPAGRFPARLHPPGNESQLHATGAQRRARALHRRAGLPARRELPLAAGVRRIADRPRNPALARRAARQALCGTFRVGGLAAVPAEPEPGALAGRATGHRPGPQPGPAAARARGPGRRPGRARASLHRSGRPGPGRHYRAARRRQDSAGVQARGTVGVALPRRPTLSGRP
jgi:MinD-like ATPase involved in chromosome partitioning or flagellar assembly